MAVRDDVQRLAAALERPRGSYLPGLARTGSAVAARSIEAARQLEVFTDRVADLTMEELCELHTETFGRGGGQAAVRIVQRLAHRPCDARVARTALDALVPVLDRLDADRNPFAYVVRALCCVLFLRLRPSPRQSRLARPSR